MTMTTMEAAQMAALSEEEQHTLERCEVAIQAGNKAFLRVGTALLTIRDRRLYRATHSNFEDYLRERWEMGKSHGYRLMEAAEVVNGLSSVGDVLPANEAQARPLAQLPAEQRQEAWQGAVEAAQGAAVTAAHVQREVAHRLGKAPAPVVADMPSPALKQNLEADNDGAQASKAEDHSGMAVRTDEHAAAAPAKRQAEAEEPAQKPLDGNDWRVRLMADMLVMQEVLRGWLPEQHGGRKRQAPYAILEEILERCGWVLKSLRSNLEIYGVTINNEAQIRDQHSAVARRIRDLERQSVEKDDVIAALSLELEQQHEVTQPGAGWVIPEDAEDLLIALAQRKRPGQTEDVSPAQYLVTLIQQRAEQAGLVFEGGKVVQR